MTAAVFGALSCNPAVRLVREAFVPPPGAALQRRAAALCIPSLVAASTVAWSDRPAHSMSAGEQIIAESRRKAKEDAKTLSIWNWNSWKAQTGNYNASDLQSFLPTVYLAQRQYKAIRQEMNNPKIDVTLADTYEVIRKQNRESPCSKLRKAIFLTQLWLRERKDNYDAGRFETDRVKRALEEQDTQLLLIARTDGKVDPAAFRVAKRNVDELVDSLDLLLELLPDEEKEVATVIAQSKPVNPMNFVVVRRVRNSDKVDKFDKVAKQE